MIRWRAQAAGGGSSSSSDNAGAMDTGHERQRCISLRRVALVVVHGMGQQDRYSQLDALTRGIVSAAGDNLRRKPRHVLVHLGADVVSAVRLTFRTPLAWSGAKTLDLYEIYWAPLSQRRLKLPRVLWWLVRTSLTPLRSWGTDPSLLHGSRGRQALIMGRELVRALVLPAAVLVLVAPFVLVATYRDSLETLGRTLEREVPSGVLAHVDLIVTGALMVLTIVLLVVAARTFSRLLRGDVEAHATARWSLAALGAAAATFGLGVIVEVVCGKTRLTDYLSAICGGVFTWELAGIVVSVVVALWLRGFLVHSLGDVTLYTTADEKSDLHEAREQILASSTATVTALLDEYQGVYLAGHSLGSVVAYDTINRLQRERRAGTIAEKQFRRLRGLVTFGSPLDKVDYFFRTRVGPGEAIRAQILASSHGFRRRATGREYGAARLARYEIGEPPGFWWVNFHARLDFVGGHLDRYVVDAQRRMPYLTLRAHSRYLHDRRFLTAVYEYL